MRKVTEQVVKAFLDSEYNACGNTSTDGQSLWLHGHKIARKTDEGIEINNCGYQTNVTKERLNGIQDLSGNGGQIFQKNFKWKFSTMNTVNTDTFEIIIGDFPSNQWININNVLGVK